MRNFLNRQRARFNQTNVEWAFVILLAGFCVLLSWLQYRWTGELSRAETERLRAGINERAQQFCRAFDLELAENCQALIPHSEISNDDNRAAIHLADFQKWRSANPPPLFSRVAVAVSAPQGTQLFEQDLATGKLTPAAWPSEWDPIRQLLSPGTRNRPPESDPFSGTLISLPVIDRQPWRTNSPDAGRQPDADGPPDVGNSPRGHGPGRFNEWMIFELDSNYLHTVWLPELTRRYLNTDAQSFNDVEIKTFPPPGTVVFSTPGAALNSSASPVKLPLNRQGRDVRDHHGPGGDFCWELEVRPHPGALEAIVAASRRRNLTVAFLLNGLIFAAALALIHHTRRSRLLAAAQMSFVATVSHELRTPLTVIRGAGHNLLRGVAREPAQIEQYSRLIIQHAENLTEMVEQILTLAGARKNASAVRREPIDIADILHEAVAVTAQDTQAAYCEVELKLPPNLPAITGDPSALRRVFQNLITNAAKHGGSGRWIGINAGRQAQGPAPGVEIQVADRGPGIPASDLPEIFKPFFRGATAQTMQIRGSGLGLSLAKEIVEAHGGSISVASHQGHGAIFVVRLPAVEPETK